MLLYFPLVKNIDMNEGAEPMPLLKLRKATGEIFGETMKKIVVSQS